MRYGKRGKRKRESQTGTPRAPGTSSASAEAGQAARAGQAAETAARPWGGAALKPWWERWKPSRLDYELAELKAAGIHYEIDEKARAGGLIHLNLTTVMGGEKLRLIALFPDIYPYTRFEIRAPDLDLKRHQNPFSKNLCVIGRATRNWETDYTLAQFIRDRVPLVIKTVDSENPVEVAALEEHQGEPFSDYYAYRPDSLVLVDSSWSIDSLTQAGNLIIGLESGAGRVLRGAVLKISDEYGRVLAVADPKIISRYVKQIEGRWARMAEPIREGDINQFFETLYERDERLRKPKRQLTSGGAFVDVIGVIFPEEQRWRNTADGWVFAISTLPHGSNYRELSLARAGRAGKADMAERIPELAPLKDRKMAVIGLGGIGAPSAIEFARCGVQELRILDGDVVDAATVVRWPLGLPVAGKSKALSLKEFIDANYPYTEVKHYHHRIGVVREKGMDPSDLEILGELLDGVDLIYDSSAEIGLHDLLSDLAAERGIPYVCTTTTFGAWGGRVVSIRPSGRTEGCWRCFQRWMYDGTIPVPPEDPNGGVQPAGCADPTFTGAGFDVASVALHGVRLAMSILAERTAGGYPITDWDVGIISLRDEHGKLINPRYDTYKIARHPECKNETAHNNHGVDT